MQSHTGNCSWAIVRGFLLHLASLWMHLASVHAEPQPWVTAANDPTEHRRTRPVCPDNWDVDYEFRDHTKPFWLPKLTLLDHIASSKPRAKHDITLAVTSSLDRLNAQDMQCQYWPGTLAVAIYLPVLNGTEDQVVLSITEEHLLDYTKQVLAGHLKVADVVQRLRQWAQHVQGLHPCRLDLNIYTEVIPNLGEFWSYPINAMRNRALAMVQTEVVISVDGDFATGPSHFLKRLFQGGHEWTNLMDLLDEKTVVIAHALDVYLMVPMDLQMKHVRDALNNGTKAYILKNHVPPPPPNVEETSDEVHQRSLKGKYLPFQPCCHGLSDHGRWMQTHEPYVVKYNTSDGIGPAWYEPYFFGLTRSLPFYDERFRGYAYNKMSYVWHLHAAGFRFIMHPEAYLMHIPHARDGGTFGPDWRYSTSLEALYMKITPGIFREGWGLPLPYVTSCDDHNHTKGIGHYGTKHSAQVSVQH